MSTTMKYAVYIIIVVVVLLGMFLYWLRKPRKRRESNLKCVSAPLPGEEDTLDCTKFFVRKRDDT